MGRLTLLGVDVDPVTIEYLIERSRAAILSGEKIVIANHNLHSVYLYHHVPRLREFYRSADVVHVDGMPLIFWARILGHRVSRSQRVTYVDLIRPLIAEAWREGWRVFYLGGKEGVAERAALLLRQDYPGLVIRTHHGYFDEEDQAANRAILDAIADFSPQLLFVGMGMPRQELWILHNLQDIQANVIFTAGACFDYIAGELSTPPRWMGRVGLEWLYRLGTEPRRLWRRYLVEPWSLLPLVVEDIARTLRLRRRSVNRRSAV